MEKLELKKTVESLPQRVRKELPVVENREQLTRANNGMNHVRDLKQQVNAAFDPQIKKANDLHKSLIGEKRVHAAPLDEAMGHLKQISGKYLADEQRKVQEERERIAQAQAKAHREAGEKQAAALKAAEEAEAAGDKEQAATMLQTAIETTPEPVSAPTPTAPKVKGLSVREVWKARVLAASLVPREFLMVDEKLLGQHVRVMKKKTNIPGVEAYMDVSTVKR